MPYSWNLKSKISKAPCGWNHKSKIINLKSFPLAPLPDISFLRVEINADFDEFPVIGGVRDEVAPVVNLGEGLVGGAVKFELEDVDVVVGFHHGIGSSLGTSYFCLGELSHEFEDEIENGLVVAFRAVVQLVGNPSKESSKAGEEGIGITFP